MTPQRNSAKSPAEAPRKASAAEGRASSNGSSAEGPSPNGTSAKGAPVKAATNGASAKRSTRRPKAASKTGTATKTKTATKAKNTTKAEATKAKPTTTAEPKTESALDAPATEALSNGAAPSAAATVPVEAVAPTAPVETVVPEERVSLKDRLAEIPDEPVSELSTVKVRPREVPALVGPEPTLNLAPVTTTSPTLGPPLLTCEGVDMAYGSVQILFDVDFSVRENEVVALLGTNGAGKSTLLKGICGLVKPKRGSVHFDGDDVTSLPADVTAHRGIALMPGGKGVFPTLTVAENLRLAAWLIRKDHRRVAEARKEVLDLFPVLRERSNQLAGDLSGGEQQMLALGGALMTKPKLLMIDELSLGLAPTVVGQLLEVVREIHERGTTIVLVEQSVNVALNLAERAVFMEKGQVRFEGAATDLLERPDILRSVFIAGAVAQDGPAGDADGSAPPADDAAAGEAVKVTARPARRAAEEVPLELRPSLLECHGVLKRFGGIRAVDEVSFGLRDGEILGLIGHNGAGKTTLMDCISGFLALDGGRVRLRGMDVTEWVPHERARGGLGRSFQDAMLFPTLTVAETLAVACERHLACRDFVAEVFRLPASYESELAVAIRVDELIDLMGLGAFRDKLTGELSTGSRRIVDLACILAQEPTVVMLDEPSAGVAQKETEALGPLLQRVRERTGCSILIIEHDMPLLREVCDTMLALELGHEIAFGPPEEVLNHPQVVESYLGTDPAAINRSGATAT